MQQIKMNAKSRYLQKAGVLITLLVVVAFGSEDKPSTRTASATLGVPVTKPTVTDAPHASCRSSAWCCTSAVASGSVDPVAASTNDGNLPANAIDANLNTRWSGEGVGANITADLGAAKTVCGVNVARYQGNTRRNSYVISLSTDGSHFTGATSGMMTRRIV